MLHFRWDLDKTYLHTDFDSLRELVATFRQNAEDKQAIAGAPTLLRALLDSDDDERRVTFISGSPRQMRRVLTEKLRIDGVEPDAFVLKPNLSNLLRFRFRALNEQLGYKLSALLRSRYGGADVREVLFGDDSEADALIYSLYADLLSGAVGRAELERALDASPLYRRDVDEVLGLYDTLPESTPTVARIFIHLDRRSPTARFARFGARVVPVYNYFQAACVLLESELLSPVAVLRVVEAMGHAGYTPHRLANSLRDLIRRGYLSEAGLNALRDAVQNARDLLKRPRALFVSEFAELAAEIRVGSTIERAWVGDVDYVEACAATQRYRRRDVVLRGMGLLRKD